jgi:hypothetical protein
VLRDQAIGADHQRFVGLGRQLCIGEGLAGGRGTLVHLDELKGVDQILVTGVELSGDTPTDAEMSPEEDSV